MEQSVPKRRHIQFRRRGITQKKEYKFQNKAEVWKYRYTDSRSSTDILMPFRLSRYVHSLTHSLSHSLIQSLNHSLNHSLTHSITHSITHSLNHPLTQSITHSITHSLTHSLTHSQALQPMQGLGRLKKPPPAISIPGPGPPVPDSQLLCILRHSINPSQVWPSCSSSALRLVQGNFFCMEIILHSHYMSCPS